MWTRAELKFNAQENLKKYYWYAFVAVFLTNLLTGTGGLKISKNIKEIEYMSEEELIALFSLILVVLVMSFLATTFLANIILVGMRRFFLCARFDDVSLKHLFDGFRGGNYENVMKTMLLMNVKVWLWSLLFVVPGIIKSYEYMMVPFILAEDPSLDTKEVFRRSRVMMDGEKWNTFVLGLSFIGWYILGVFACCIGIYFVEPYKQATFTELYDRLRGKALPPKQDFESFMESNFRFE